MQDLPKNEPIKQEDEELKTDICAKDCPKFGESYPHSPHKSLYNTEVC